MCVISFCTRGALDSWSRGRSTATLGDMAGVFAYTCTCCGKRHEGSPSFGFDAPHQYASLSAEQKLAMGELSSDLCTITHNGEVDRFIRTVLEIPIVGAQDPFMWGVWVSLSDKSYA